MRDSLPLFSLLWVLIYLPVIVCSMVAHSEHGWVNLLFTQQHAILHLVARRSPPRSACWYRVWGPLFLFPLLGECWYISLFLVVWYVQILNTAGSAGYLLGNMWFCTCWLGDHLLGQHADKRYEALSSSFLSWVSVYIPPCPTCAHSKHSWVNLPFAQHELVNLHMAARKLSSRWTCWWRI